MSILITGGAGFIGSHTAVELLNVGKDIIIADNFSNSKPQVLDKIKEITGKVFKFYEADILDKPAFEKIFAENKIESVIHFAGLKAVGESVAKPLEYYQNNIAGTVNLLQVMAAAGCKNIVFSSSATVYGANPDVPFKETHPTMAATNPYGSTKLMLETVLKDLYISDNSWSIALLRYFNPIGAHPSGLIGESPNGIPNNILPIITHVATGKLDVLNVTGNDYDTPDGTGVRDYLHVVDLANGHVKAVDYLADNKGVLVVNLGTGKGYSVLDIIKAFEKVSGKVINYKFAPRRPGDIATCYADPSKAKEVLGWQAKYDIDEMCRDSWNFASKNS